MIRDDFSVEIANYDLDQAALRSVRDIVFVQEQNVPTDIELDAIDPQCRHVLARDAQGRAIGTGRLTPQRSIGRMAVLREWRGRGVGEALLQALLDLAREFGFEPVGEEYLEAGIRHRTMRRALDPFPDVARAPLAPKPESLEVSIETLAQAQDLALDIVRSSRRHLWLYSRDLDRGLYGGPEMVEAVKQFAIAGRGGELRILLHDAATPLREGHPLVPLLQRLSSCILVRVPQDEQDLQYPAAFLAGDGGGYLFRPIGSRFEGSGNRYAPGRQRQLRDYFDQVWERSLPTPELRQILI
jgi:predicted GNAT family N-acyltransferase